MSKLPANYRGKKGTKDIIEDDVENDSMEDNEFM
jgi:hypothetical protein